LRIFGASRESSRRRSDQKTSVMIFRTSRRAQPSL
jgi:hypothetical protein